MTGGGLGTGAQSALTSGDVGAKWEAWAWRGRPSLGGSGPWRSVPEYGGGGMRSVRFSLAEAEGEETEVTGCGRRGREW